MQTGRIKAEKLFREYRNKVERSAVFYNKLCGEFPGQRFPLMAQRIWREGVLAEMWGTIATQLSREGINYLENWREGK